MLNKKILIGIIGTSLIGFGVSAFAQNAASNSDIYVGGQIGYGDTHWDNVFNGSGVSSVSSHDTGFAGRIFAGYDFNQYFAVETGYTLFPKTDIKIAGVKAATVDTSAVDLVGKITAPLTNKIGIYAKAGAGYLDSSLSSGFTVNGKGDCSNVNLVYGVGAQYQIMPQLVADVSFTRFNGNNDLNSSRYQPNADLYAVGVAYKFNLA